jgi:cyclopropane fatty-acyl-phospholipid synthase-like methyltransferase
MDFAAGRKKFDVSAFTYCYVFPGDHTPVVLPELYAAANRTDLEPVALHNDRHSYFLTLQAWARNLDAARRELVERFGERGEESSVERARPRRARRRSRVGTVYCPVCECSSFTPAR